MVRELYRPVGLFELRLIEVTKYHAFPPRLPSQPIFYPVLNIDYAMQIAREWNTKDPQSGYMGAVMLFRIPTNYLERYEVQTVGAAVHQELWIPAEDLDAFNEQIIGIIEIAAVFYGEQFQGVREW